jgi:hypothetical protein
MGRLLGVLSLAVLAAGVLSGAALAKEMGVELSSTPAGIEPGEPWTPTLYLLAGPPELFADAKPGVRIQNIETVSGRGSGPGPQRLRWSTTYASSSRTPGGIRSRRLVE